MEIQRIDSYTDPRFPQEVLYQHGAFLVDGAPWSFRVISDHEAEVTGEGLTRETLAEAAEAMPMMAERTLVSVTDWDLFKLGEDQREKLIALLQSGSLFDFEVDSCLVALGSIGDQRFADNTVDEKMLERARSCISRVPDIYIDVLATRFDRAREVVDMLLSGQKLEADQEAYLLVMLEGND